MTPDRAALDFLIAEATVDCYNDSECVTGLYTMLDEHLEVPFKTAVLDLDLPLPDPAPSGAEWVAAYRRWRRWER